METAAPSSSGSPAPSASPGVSQPSSQSSAPQGSPSQPRQSWQQPGRDLSLVKEADAGGEQQSEAQKAEERRLRRLQLSSGDELEMDESEWERYAKTGYEFQKTAEKTEQKYQQTMKMLQALKENPAEVLEALGIDPSEIGRQRMLQQIEEEMMTPEEREQRDLRRKLEKYESSEKAQREAALKAQREAEDRQLQDGYDKSIRSALEAAGLGVNDWFYGSVINKMATAMNAGFADIQPEHVIPYVEAEFRSQMDNIFKMPYQQLVRIMGQSNIDQLQKLVIENARGQRAPKQPKEEGLPKPMFNERGQKGLSLSEWQEEAKRRMAADRRV